MSQSLTDPETDADRIRMKRLARLGQPAASSSSPSSTSASTSTSVLAPAPLSAPAPKSSPLSAANRKPESPVTTVPTPLKKKAVIAPAKFDQQGWENDVLTDVFRITLDPSVALVRGYDAVWLKAYMEDEAESFGGDLRMSVDRLEPAVIARLDMDVSSLVADEEYRPFLSRVPKEQTVYEYLVACWKRLNSAKAALLRKGYAPVDVQVALQVLERMRHLIVSYIGIYLMGPDAFPAPPGKEVGSPEFVESLLSLGAFSNPLFGGSSASEHTLDDGEIESFLNDFVRRFAPDDELPDVLSDVIRRLLFHPTLFKPEGLAATDSRWRGVVGALEALAVHKEIARMIVSMEEWLPANATAATLETISLLGPLMRLNVFGVEWPSVMKTYFAESETRPAADLESARNTLRGALRDLHGKLFKVLNVFVRADVQCREAVLSYFSRVVSLNSRRSGSHVDPTTVATDSFMTNVYAVLLQFAEPFMDATYSKIDRIDRLYYAHSNRVELNDETRINATSAVPPNFISDIFYLTLSIGHYGLSKTFDNFEELGKRIEDYKRSLASIEDDGTWAGTPLAPRMEATIKAWKDRISDFKAQQEAALTQLADQEFLFKNNNFMSYLTTWLIRYADPRRAHPKPFIELPLPREVPLDFRLLPEYILDNIIVYYVFVMRIDPRSMNVSGKEELMTFLLTCLSSTWYIKNPHLKNKLIDARVLYYGIFSWYRQEGLLTNLLNSHPLALKNLIPALMTNYIEVEHTGASSQFYDKFHARREIASVLRVIWNNSAHRRALSDEARETEKFIRFVNLMINDVTYLLDESLSDMTQIRAIELQMDDTESWDAKTQAQKREIEKNLRSLEGKASSYNQLCESTLDMLRIFTAETKAPFMAPEIVGKLAAMLDYNLDVLAGTRTSELKVKDKAKYHFKPRELLSTIVQVYLNLSDQAEFAQAVASDGRSYRKELFQKAAGICVKANLKSLTEIEQLRLFVIKVEEAKAAIEAEEELGEVPDEFLDPLMYTVMRDPVILPTSRQIIDRSTIKAHLLSDPKDPFNRAPLAIEDVIPDVELKAKIEAFLAARRNNNTAHDKSDDDIAMFDTAAVEEAAAAMDTNE
ncbi:ubiquitin conjugation factor E4 [Vararia minispora EC-137]|uniref:Ubiquitin conjugation factor E4 n=1 Tax=Vararia minispora EC-137 TaxID=1314806 RepID=A0ACB8QY19_9AGAM|nr:ubiquitin conjugation factor E4 [Vararia minispora EC-137]